MEPSSPAPAFTDLGDNQVVWAGQGDRPNGGIVGRALEYFGLRDQHISRAGERYESQRDTSPTAGSPSGEPTPQMQISPFKRALQQLRILPNMVFAPSPEKIPIRTEAAFGKF
eukprot:2747152-Pyramimonas_sp.AAC.1